MTIFLIGWIAISIFNYVLFNTTLVQSLIPDIPESLLWKSINYNIYAIGASTCTDGKPGTCSSQVKVYLDQTTQDAYCNWYGDSQTCQIYGSLKMETIVSATLRVQFLDDYSFVQGWIWQFNVYDQPRDDTHQKTWSDSYRFIPTAVGRQISVPYNATNVFHGPHATTDVLFVTSWVFQSSLHPGTSYEAFALNTTGQPILGDYYNTFYEVLGGPSLAIKLLFNGYTIYVQEQPLITFVELLVTLFSVVGGAIAIGRLKVATEFVINKLTKKKYLLLTNQEDKDFTELPN